MHSLRAFNDRRKAVVSKVQGVAKEVGDRVAGYQPGQRKQETANRIQIGRSETAFNQTMGPQVQGDWSSPTSDWKETMAQKESHNW